jgi:hypothetical protein
MSVHERYTEEYFQLRDADRIRLRRELNQSEENRISDLAWAQGGGYQHRGCSDWREMLME